MILGKHLFRAEFCVAAILGLLLALAGCTTNSSVSEASSGQSVVASQAASQFSAREDGESDELHRLREHQALHTALLIRMNHPPISDLELELDFRRTYEGVADLELTIIFPPESKYTLEDIDGALEAACTPITDDGYFLTAQHCVDAESAWVFYHDISDSKKSNPMPARLRIVYSDANADFAIVKAELVTPRYLQLRDTPLVKREPLISGNVWVSGVKKGKYHSNSFVSSHYSDSELLWKVTGIRTTIPLDRGDSGSPLIDSEGRLCGISRSMFVRKWWRRIGFWSIRYQSSAVMYSKKRIFDIIAEDRRKQIEESGSDLVVLRD